ncbi:MAG: MFS transporter, partial [Planctomycetota bacterium]
DRFGVGRVWRVMTVSMLLGAAGFWLVRSLGWPLYTARTLFAVGLAGGFTAANLFVQTRAPAGRGTEAIGTLGTSGFIGLIIGTQIGDRFFFDPADGFTYDVIFGLTTLLAVANTAAVFWVTRDVRHRRPEENPPLHRLMLRHQPLGPTAVALVMGGVFCVTQVFLTRFATSLGIADIGMFFAGYAVSAFSFRLLTRKWSQRIGRHRMLVIGLTGYVVGFATLTTATAEWQFVFPAVCIGFGHALLFPSVVSLISEAYPPAYRGSGTNAALGCMEFGTLASAPLFGAAIDGLAAGYAVVFLGLVATSAVVLVTYGSRAWRAHDPESEVAVRAVRRPADTDTKDEVFSDLPAVAEPVGR